MAAITKRIVFFVGMVLMMFMTAAKHSKRLQVGEHGCLEKINQDYQMYLCICLVCKIFISGELHRLMSRDYQSLSHFTRHSVC
jgi:hypothetical protein